MPIFGKWQIAKAHFQPLACPVLAEWNSNRSEW